MDVGEIAVYLQSIGSVNEQLVKIIKDQCRKHLEIILADVSETTGVSLSELREKYLCDIEIGEFSSASVLTKSRKKINTAIRCCARTSKGGRCTRKRKTERFCGSHEHSRPYGEITNDDESSLTETEHIKRKPVVKEKKKTIIGLSSKDASEITETAEITEATEQTDSEPEDLSSITST